MKIACVGTGWYPQYPGGLEKYVYGMTQAFINAGDSVDLFVLGEPSLDAAPSQAYSIGDPATPTWKRLLAARRQFARSFRGPYDVVNLHFAMNALPLLPFIRHTAPRVVTFHGPWGAESRAEGGGSLSVAIKEALERFVYKSSDRYIVLSTAFKEILAGYGVEPERIHVIPMGIDCTFFTVAENRAGVRTRLGWPQDKFVFFTARRLVHRVGLFELIEAVSLLRASRKNFILKIAGKGPLNGELEAAIGAAGLNEVVQLLGFVTEDDLVRSYQAADLTILPTQSLEGFGTIISESLACGTPIIVTPVGGMPEAVAPLSPDLIMRSASAPDIAALMESVLTGAIALPNEAACRTFAVERFDWKVIVQQIRSVFEHA